MSAKAEQPSKPAAKRTKLIIGHGDKGGVGKSMVNGAILDLLLSKGEPVALVEADTQNPDVARMFEGTMPIAFANVRSDTGWMDVMDFVMKHQGHTIVLNTPAGIGEYMKQDMASFVKFFEEQDVKVDMELWWTMNIQHDSVNLLNEAYKSYGQFFKNVRVICNLHFANGDKKQAVTGPFLLWLDSPLRTQIEKKGNKTIFFPGLHIRVVEKLLKPETIMPFFHAEDASMGAGLKFEYSERWKLTSWREAVEVALAESLGLPEPAVKAAA